MSKSRKFLYITVSGGFHMLAAVIVMFLAQPTGQVYENIEVTSYVTPIVKPNENKLEKPKYEKVNEIADQSKELSNETKTPIGGTSHEEIAEELAADGAITSPAVLITKTKANRTEAARQADYSGVAQVELVIGSDGAVKNAKLRNSLPYGLDEVALRIARESKFRPAMINNKPVASAILFKVRFESEK